MIKAMKPGVFATLLGLALGAVNLLAAAPWYRVASVDVAHPAQCPFVVSAEPYQYNTAQVPTENLPADAPERTLLFGADVAFCFQGVKAGAQYQIRAALLSDDASRS